MAASRRLLVGFTPILSIQPSSSFLKPLLLRNLYSTHHLLPLHFTNKSILLSSSKPHFFYRNITSSAATVDTFNTETTAINSSSSYSHPWPEWVEFLGKLKSKGYLDEKSLPSIDDDVDENDNDDGENESVGGGYTSKKKELNVYRNACLTFARNRYDIYRSLSKEHIQVVVECGCPNLYRKVVNSAKRLRAALGLDEGDVCSACNLRGSCDRAYGILKDSEASARTVDIVRMLLIYALDSPVLSGGEMPHGKENVEASVRKLLSELSELSETIPDPALPEPAVKVPKQKPEKKMVHEASQDVEMKRGDWICSNCDFMNFSRNLRCLQCKTEGPKRSSVDDVEMKKGDWTCTECEFMNFARNTQCLRCKSKRPKRVLLPGEWECPSCDYLNYRRNKACLKCNHDRPKDEVGEYDEQIWRKPY